VFDEEVIVKGVLELLRPPPKTERGIPVFARGARKAEGRTLGGTRRCRMDGCAGIRIAVRWNSGKMTWPCSKGMSRSNKGWRIL
jgi:hypothetical protein